VLDSGWYYATLFFGETQIRTGHLLVGAFKKNELRRALTNLSREFGKINIDTLAAEHRTIWRNSEEENLRPMDGSGLRAAGTPGAEDAAGPRGTTALDRFSQDLTAKAASGEMDPILGRDEEIRLFIDEAHTLIGAGGPAGTGDAANLLKPALARGTLRTIAATTWLEYQKYFEKDPALTRRFQPIQVGEPDVAKCCDMLRGILKPM